MVQRSRFWDGTSVGDATVAPYDAGTEFAEVMIGVAGHASNPNKGGMLTSMSVSMFVPGTLRVGPFEALVYGTWYQNDANSDFVIATPAAATRIDTVVLRKSWAAQTVRILILSGVEGGSAPPLVQTVGVTWDVPVATVSTTTGGVSTVTQTSSRADLWYRTSINAIRTDSNAGVGVTPKTSWSADYRALQLASGGMVASHITFPQLVLASNSYYDTANVPRAIAAGLSARVTMGQDGVFYFDNAANAAADGSQTFIRRAMLNADGNFTVGLDAPYPIHPARRAIFISDAAMFMSGAGYNALEMRVNSYQNSSNQPIAMYAGTASSLTLSNDTLTYGNSPHIAAGAVQAFITRMSIAGTGAVAFNPMASAANSAQVPVTLNTWGPTMGDGESQLILLDTGNGWKGTIGLTYPNASLTLRSFNGPVTLRAVSDVLVTTVAAGYFRPTADNSTNLGHPSFRWGTVYSSVGTINTSKREYKEAFVPVDPNYALDVVRRTPILSYNYKTLPGRRFTGFIADNADSLLSPDQDSVDPGTTASVALAAIQALATQNRALLTRIEALEGKVN